MDSEEKPDSEEKDLQPTGALVKSKSRSRYYFTTQDLLIMAILGVMGGFIDSLVPFDLLVKTWYPFTGGTELVSAHYLLWWVIAYGITRKKSSILVTAAICGVVEFLLGSSWGAFEILVDVFEGACLLIGFVLMEHLHEGNTNLGWAFAAGLGNIPQVPLFWYITAKFPVIGYSLFIMAVMLAFVSGVFMAGISGKIYCISIK